MFKKETFIFDLKHFSLSLLTTVVPHVKKFIYCATVSTRCLTQHLPGLKNNDERAVGIASKK
jgi:hypothetical protein